MPEQHRKLFLDQVKLIVEKDPSKDLLFELLKLTWPALAERRAAAPTLRGKAFKQAKGSLEEADDEDADELLASVESFFEKCVDDIKNQKKQKASCALLAAPSGGKAP